MDWGYDIFGLIVLVVAFYTVIPDFFLHRLGLGSWKRQYTDGVALTFDDGPDPVYTGRILEILHRYQVKATFFVVVEKALRYPEMIERIKAEGHHLGVHSFHHRYAWFVPPRRTWKEWDQSIRLLENLTGEEINWIRPPWGTFNLITWLWLRRRKKQAILWNVEGHDWLVKRSAEQITERILAKANEGSIIVLHDSGGDSGAPEHSLKALEILCQRITTEKKLPLRALEFPAWSRLKRIEFFFWEMWEHFFAKLYHIERIDATNILRLAKTRYNGPDLWAEDGSGRLLAKKGDIVAEIHLDSIRLQAKGQDMQKIGVQAMRKAIGSFPVLARYIAESPEYRDIQVFMGLTLLSRGVKGFGFSVTEVPGNWFSYLVGLIQRAVMGVYHPAGKKGMSHKLETQPKLVWISREKLLNKWLNR